MTPDEKLSIGCPPNCPLLHAPGPIWGEGSPTAKVFLVGEAPWKDEETERRVFVGAAGKVLNIALAEAGLARRDCFIDNVCKCVTLSPTAEAVNTCVNAHLKRQLAAKHEYGPKERPNVIVALGGKALSAIKGFEGITKWRGHLLEIES